MPRRSRSNLDFRHESARKRQAVEDRRAVETSPDRARRLETDRQRHQEERANETPDQTRRRLAEQQARQRDYRAAQRDASRLAQQAANQVRGRVRQADTYRIACRPIENENDVEPFDPGLMDRVFLQQYNYIKHIIEIILNSV